MRHIILQSFCLPFSCLFNLTHSFKTQPRIHFFFFLRLLHPSNHNQLLFLPCQRTADSPPSFIQCLQILQCIIFSSCVCVSGSLPQLDRSLLRDLRTKFNPFAYNPVISMMFVPGFRRSVEKVGLHAMLPKNCVTCMSYSTSLNLSFVTGKVIITSHKISQVLNKIKDGQMF